MFSYFLTETILSVFQKDLKVEWWQSEAYLYPGYVHSWYRSLLCVLMLVETTNQETTKWVKTDHLWQNHFKALEIVIQSLLQWLRPSLTDFIFELSHGHSGLLKATSQKWTFIQIKCHQLSIWYLGQTFAEEWNSVEKVKKKRKTVCFFLDHSSTNVLWSNIMCLRSRFSRPPGNPWTLGTSRCCGITW